MTLDVSGRHPAPRLSIAVRGRYWLEVDAMTVPMTLRDDGSEYGGGDGAREKRDGE